MVVKRGRSSSLLMMVQFLSVGKGFFILQGLGTAVGRPEQLGVKGLIHCCLGQS